MYYISSLSGGISSAVATDRAIQRYGRNKVWLWFADTTWEDDDLYRFLDDCAKRWGGKLFVSRDGRTPLQVAEDKHIVPNQKMAPCSFVLKVDRFTEWLWRVPRPVTVLLGLDWSEIHRTHAPRQHYEQIPGVYVDFPLLWKPYCYDYFAEVRSWGIETPRLYQMGFPHNNCGGRCVRQGIREWQRLRIHFPKRFAEVRDWEHMQRAKGGKLAEYAIARDQSNGRVRPLTLAELEQRDKPQPGEPVQEDLFACFCSY
jgi:hypothetical protein